MRKNDPIYSDQPHSNLPVSEPVIVDNLKYHFDYSRTVGLEMVSGRAIFNICSALRYVK